MKKILLLSPLASVAILGCAHQSVSKSEVEGPSEFVFPTYPYAKAHRSNVQVHNFVRFIETKDGRITSTKNDIVRYEVGVQLVKLENGCFKTTSEVIGSKAVKTVMTTTSPPTPIENIEPVLKIETVSIDCTKYF